MIKLAEILKDLEQGKISSDHAEKQVLELFSVTGSLPSDIREEMDADIVYCLMAQGEIESCLNHWSNKCNKYIIIRKESIAVSPFIPTAMRCNKQQFEAIKPKLIERGCNLIDIVSFYHYKYLVNNSGNEKNMITNSLMPTQFNRTVYEDWDEAIFLRNLGGEK